MYPELQLLYQIEQTKRHRKTVEVPKLLLLLLFTEQSALLVCSGIT